MKIQHDRLLQIVTAIFQSGGCRTDEAERIARHLVEANLVGHDSHGVIRVWHYVQWMRRQGTRQSRHSDRLRK